MAGLILAVTACVANTPIALVKSPLSGKIDKGVWQYADQSYPGISGGAMHYAYLLPANYTTSSSYPVLVYEHENNEGNQWYKNHGDPTINTIVNQMEMDGAFNTVAFRTQFPAIVIVLVLRPNRRFQRNQAAELRGL